MKGESGSKRLAKHPTDNLDLRFRYREWSADGRVLGALQACCCCVAGSIVRMSRTGIDSKQRCTVASTLACQEAGFPSTARFSLLRCCPLESGVSPVRPVQQEGASVELITPALGLNEARQSRWISARLMPIARETTDVVDPPHAAEKPAAGASPRCNPAVSVAILSFAGRDERSQHRPFACFPGCRRSGLCLVDIL